MKKGKNATAYTIIGVVVLVVVILLLRSSDNEAVPMEIAQCIGENSHLYVSLGCHYCEQQEAMFGSSYKYLTVTDCFYNRQACANIQGTPTWMINGQSYIGVQSIENLQELTGC